MMVLGTIGREFESRYPDSMEICKCKYCNKQYKNKISLGQHQRFCKLNPNAQISPFVEFNKHNTESNAHIWNKGLSKTNDDRVKKQSETLKKKYKSGELVSKFKGKHLSETTKKKISETVKARLEQNPSLAPYLLNHSSKQSYPEKYFSDLFKNDNVLCQCLQEYPVSRYRLDFAIPKIKFYIEIDGEQHYVDERIIKHDKERDNKLQELGWFGIRIRWSNFKKLSYSKRNEKIDEIKKIVIERII